MLGRRAVVDDAGRVAQQGLDCNPQCTLSRLLADSFTAS
jgi:hypothetical protein